MSRPRLLNQTQEEFARELAKRWPLTQIAKRFSVSRSTIVRTVNPDARFRLKLREALGGFARGMCQNSSSAATVMALKCDLKS